MKKFFVPSAWDKETATIKFKSVASKHESNSVDSKTSSAQKKKKHKACTSAGGTSLKLSPAPKHNLKPAGKSPIINKGRVTKAKLNNSPKKLPGVAFIKTKSANFIRGKNGLCDTKSLEAKLKQNLMGGRFRYINEQLYTINSQDAEQLFDEDNDAFTAYHEGYRHQVLKWPINPLDKMIKMVNKLPKNLIVGDFGCGEGKLSKSVPNKVFSMDLVKCRDDIISCDMANTPLNPQTLDVAVYCLSLMGTNLNDYLIEANRVLRMEGLLYIAEIQSRFDDVHKFIKCLQSCGFSLIKKDISVKLFYFFQFKKVRNVGKVALLQPFSLKPCLYRKR